MKVQVKLFAVMKQLSASESITVELPEGATVGEFRKSLADQYPDLAAFAPQVLIAVEQEYCDDTSAIPPDAELACIPPVSGG